MYESSQGVLKDDKESVKWYRKAADNGNVNAQFNLGVTYINGTGVPKKDLVQAKYWIMKAHEGGNSEAAKVWDKVQLWRY